MVDSDWTRAVRRYKYEAVCMCCGSEQPDQNCADGEPNDLLAEEPESGSGSGARKCESAGLMGRVGDVLCDTSRTVRDRVKTRGIRGKCARGTVPCLVHSILADDDPPNLSS